MAVSEMDYMNIGGISENITCLLGYHEQNSGTGIKTFHHYKDDQTYCSYASSGTITINKKGKYVMSIYNEGVAQHLYKNGSKYDDIASNAISSWVLDLDVGDTFYFYRNDSTGSTYYIWYIGFIK